VPAGTIIEYVEDANGLRRRLVDTTGKVIVTPGTITSPSSWQPKHVTAAVAEANVAFSPAIASGWIYNNDTINSVWIGFNASTAANYNIVGPQQVINFEFTAGGVTKIYYKAVAGTPLIEIFAV
jgi:hypothetical protein